MAKIKDEPKTIGQQVGAMTSRPIYQRPKYYASQLYKMSQQPNKYTMSGKSYPTTQEMVDSTPELQGFDVMPKYYTTYMEKKSGKEFKWPAYTGKQVMEEKDLGGIIGDTASFAAMGSAAIPIPGVGTLIGAGVGLAKGLFSHFKEKKDERLANASVDQAELDVLNKQKASMVGGSYNPYTATAPYGGSIGQPNVELEKEEVFQTPDGQMGQVDGPSHTGGGVEMSLEPGTRVWSDRLVASTGKTFAEEAENIKKQITKYEKILS